RPARLEVGERRSAPGRNAVALAVERDGEVPELIAKAAGEQREEATLQRERRRMQAREERREVGAPEREDGGGLEDANARGVSAAVEQGDPPEDLARADRSDLHRPVPGQIEQDRQRALDDEQHLAPGVPRAPEGLALAHDPPAHHARQLRQVLLLAAVEE